MSRNVVVLIACVASVLAAAPTMAQQQQQQAVPQPVAERAADIEERLIDLQVQVATMRSLATNVAPVPTGVPSQQAATFAVPSPEVHQQIAALEVHVDGSFLRNESRLRQVSCHPPRIDIGARPRNGEPRNERTGSVDITE